MHKIDKFMLIIATLFILVACVTPTHGPVIRDDKPGNHR